MMRILKNKCIFLIESPIMNDILDIKIPWFQIEYLNIDYSDCNDTLVNVFIVTTVFARDLTVIFDLLGIGYSDIYMPAISHYYVKLFFSELNIYRGGNNLRINTTNF